MGVVVLPKTLTAKTEAKAADVMADFQAILNQVNGNLNLENLAESLRLALIPAGTLLGTARSSAPSGFLLCQGQAVSRTTYAVLFAAIGTTYGAGDGVTTFNLPDFRGRALVAPDAGAGRLGTNNALGNSGGHSQMQSHTHPNGGGTSVESGTHKHNFDGIGQVRHEGGGFAYNNIDWTPGSGFTLTSTETDFHTHALTGSTGSSGSGNAQNMPPYQVANIMVKT